MGRRAKYKARPDGLRETTKSYKNFGPSRYTGRKHFYGHSDDEVDAKIEAFEKAMKSAPEKKARSFGKVAGDWWQEKEPTLSPNSVCGYRTALHRADEEFGSIPIDEITPQQCIAYLKRFAAQGYSMKVITNTKIVLKGILDHAFAAGDINSNPCANLPPIKGAGKKKRHAAEDEDIQIIERTKTQSLFARMSYFMLYTGCRRGEAAALQQKNIDREKKKARIVQAVAYSDTRKPQLKLPKSEAGFREIDLYDNVLEILPEYEDPETYVFFPDGLPTKTYLEAGLKKYQEENGIRATAHQLRHSYASMLHSAGIDVKDAQHLLGHSTIAMTQDVYTEIEKAHGSEIRETVNAFIQDRKLNKEKKTCPECGSRYVKAPDGHVFTYCPDCGEKLV